MKTRVAIVGSGNIGTDLTIKILETSDVARDGRAGRHRPRVRTVWRGPGRGASPPPMRGWKG